MAMTMGVFCFNMKGRGVWDASYFKFEGWGTGFGVYDSIQTFVDFTIQHILYEYIQTEGSVFMDVRQCIQEIKFKHLTMEVHNSMI